MEPVRRIRVAALAGVLFCAVSAWGSDRGSGRHDGKPLPAAAKIDRLVIDKSERRMEAWSGEVLLKVYEVALGKGKPGPKRMRGDNRTPEGRYRIDRRFVSQKFHRFLHVSYPSAADRERFAELKAAGRISKSASIGGDIGIHGERKGLEWLPHKWVNWTQGCIAVDNDEIEELYRAVKQNAEVVIRP